MLFGPVLGAGFPHSIIYTACEYCVIAEEPKDAVQGGGKPRPECLGRLTLPSGSGHPSSIVERALPQSINIFHTLHFMHIF